MIWHVWGYLGYYKYYLINIGLKIVSMFSLTIHSRNFHNFPPKNLYLMRCVQRIQTLNALQLLMGEASENVIGQVDLHSGFYCSASQYTCQVSKYYEKFINKYNLIKKNTEIKFKLPQVQTITIYSPCRTNRPEKF